VPAEQYFKKPFEPILSTANFVDFRILENNVAMRLDDSAPPRRYVSLFDTCVLDGLYRGYDLDAVAHRVLLPQATPRIVLVAKGLATTTTKKQKSSKKPKKKDKDKIQEEDIFIPADEDPTPLVEPPRVLSRKERRHKRKKQQDKHLGDDPPQGTKEEEPPQLSSSSSETNIPSS